MARSHRQQLRKLTDEELTDMARDLKRQLRSIPKKLGDIAWEGFRRKYERKQKADADYFPMFSTEALADEELAKMEGARR